MLDLKKLFAKWLTDYRERFTNYLITGNIDNLSLSGFYVYDQNTTTGTFPNTTRYGTLLHFRGTSDNFCFQIAKPNAANDDYFIRTKSSGSWLIWRTVRATRGSRTSGNGSASITSGGTAQQLSSAISLTEGVWLLIGEAEFPANSTGMRRLHWQDSNGSVYNASRVSLQNTGGSYNARLQSICTATVSSGIDMYLYATQNSGSSMTVTYNYQLVRLQ